jgi:hypothetical protein
MFFLVKSWMALKRGWGHLEKRMRAMAAWGKNQRMGQHARKRGRRNPAESQMLRLFRPKER